MKILGFATAELIFLFTNEEKKMIFLRVQQIFRKCFESWQFKLIFVARLLAESWHEGVIDYNSRCITFIQKWKILSDFKYQNYSRCWVGRMNEYFEKKIKKTLGHYGVHIFYCCCHLLSTMRIKFNQPAVNSLLI